MHSEPPESEPPGRERPPIQSGAQPSPGGDTVNVPAILVVDDEPGVRHCLRMILEGAGYRVFEAGSAEEALGMPDASLDAVGLVLADILMPGAMKGVELARRLRQRRPGLQVILTSGSRPGMEGTETAVLYREGFRFLEKPFSVQALLTTVKSSLTGR